MSNLTPIRLVLCLSVVTAMGACKGTNSLKPMTVAAVTIPTADSCQTRFRTMADMTSGSTPYTIGTDVELTVYPDKESTLMTVSKLPGYAQFLGYIVNSKAGTYPDLHTGAHSQGVTCVYVDGAISGVRGVATYIPPSSYPKGANEVLSEWMWVCIEPTPISPHAHWVQQPKCGELIGPADSSSKSASEVQVFTAQHDIDSVVAALNKANPNIPWISCASDGCCRIKA